MAGSKLAPSPASELFFLGEQQLLSLGSADKLAFLKNAICSDSKQSQSSICPKQEEGPSWKVYDGKYFSKRETKYLSETEKKYLSDAETLPQQGADQG